MVFDIFKIPCLTQYLIHSVSSVNICEFKNDEIKKKKEWWNWKKNTWFKRTSFETNDRVSLCDVITELTDICALVNFDNVKL